MMTKRVALIIMCATLALTVILAGIVIARVSPVLGALLSTPGTGTEPSTQPTTGQTTAPTTGPTTTTTTTAPTTAPTTRPTTVPTEPGHIHEFVFSEKQEPNCEDAGFSTYVCSCGEREIKDLIDPKGHSYGPGKKVAATCEEKGYTLFICRICEWEDERNYEEPTGHEYELTDTVEVSCEQNGYEEYICTVCESIKLENEQEAPGHDFQVVGEPVSGNCTEEGYTLYRCNNPGCGEEKKSNVIPAPGHVIMEWEITKEPEPGILGEETGECIECGEKVIRPQRLQIDPNNTEDGDTGAIRYFVTASAKDKSGKTVTVYTYHVYSHGEFDLEFDYYPEKDELIVSFTDPDGELQEYIVTPNVELTIDADGKILPIGP